MAKALHSVGGEEVKVKSPLGAPRLTISLRPDRLVQFGVHPTEVLEAVQAAYQGMVVAQSYQGNAVTGVRS